MRPYEPGPPLRRPMPLLYRLACEIAVRFDAAAPVGFSCVAYETTVLLVHGHRAIRNLDLALADFD